MSPMTQELLVLKAKQETADKVLSMDSYSNVLAIGRGKEGDQTTDCVKIFVQSKAACAGPAMVNSLNVPTEVVEIGRLARMRQGAASNQPLGPGFPIRYQTNSPNVSPRALGTLGATVKYGADYFLLSCNHILAVNGRVPAGSRIVSAELLGSQLNPAEIATFLGDGYFVPIQPGVVNLADCALARLDSNRIPKNPNKPFVTPKDPELLDKVTKNGAITRETTGIIVSDSVDVFVDYSFGTFRFGNQILIDGGADEFAWDGDSGSIVLDKDGNPVAMVFAESGRFAVACPLSSVFGALATLDKFKGRDYAMSMTQLNSV